MNYPYIIHCKIKMLLFFKYFCPPVDDNSVTMDKSIINDTTLFWGCSKHNAFFLQQLNTPFVFTSHDIEYL